MAQKKRTVTDMPRALILVQGSIIVTAKTDIQEMERLVQVLEIFPIL